VLEFGTLPALSSVTVPADVPDPEQLLLLKNVYVTVPVAMNPFDGVTDEVSYADAPVTSDPDHGAFVAASNTTVAVFDDPTPTANGSHPLVDPL
jgi:hypothetical protein